jgi:hypothetical protein
MGPAPIRRKKMAARDKTGTLPGMEHKKDKKLRAAAEAHQEAKDAFARASEHAQETKGQLIAEMQRFGAENTEYVETTADKSQKVIRHQLPDGETIVATMKTNWDVKIKAAKQEEE